MRAAIGILLLAGSLGGLVSGGHAALKGDRERGRIIREGHTGAGMLPDTTLTDQEITDTLAYLAVLRRQ